MSSLALVAMKTGLTKTCVLFGTIASFLPASPSAFALEKPNIILILADDISAREFPMYGSSKWTGRRAQTPVMERLAKEGALIETMWSAPLCKPSRAAMMTGRYPHLTKWWDNSAVGQGPEGGLYGIPDSSPLTIAEVARKAGYRTIWGGKTHITNGSSALRFGFDEGVFSPGEPDKSAGKNPHERFINVGDPDYWNNISFFWWPELQIMRPHDKPGADFEWVKTEISDFAPDKQLDHIMGFMERSQAAGKPFFVCYTPHLGHKSIDMANPDFPNVHVETPKIEWDAATASYRRFEPNIVPNGPTNTKATTYTKTNVTDQTITSHIEYLDYQVWQLIKHLEKSKALDNTVIIFAADNGTVGYGKGSVDRQLGVHVPLLVYAPGEPNLRKGLQSVCADLTDLLPTVAELSGSALPPPDEYELNGKSLWPYLTQKNPAHRDWIYSFSRDRQLIRNQTALRDGNKKWWDVSQPVEDLISFPPLADDADAESRLLFESVLPRFAKYNEEFDAPGFTGESRKPKQGNESKKQKSNQMAE